MLLKTLLSCFIATAQCSKSSFLQSGNIQTYDDSMHSFNRVSTFLTCSQIEESCNDPRETVAEIVAASDDGMTLVYTDRAQHKLGFVDITVIDKPKGLGFVELDGESTSVSVKENYALVCIDTSLDLLNPSGKLVVVQIDTQEIIASYDIGGQPDSISISPDKRFAAIAVKNESNENQDEGGVSQESVGFLVVFDISNVDPTAWSSSAIDISGMEGLVTSGDPKPEFVSINEENIAAVTLQENNAIVKVDLNLSDLSSFNAGLVDLDLIDTKEEDFINQTSSLKDVPREPDAICWIDNDHFVTADEGSRGFTIFHTNGDVVYSSGNDLEHIAASLGHYPENRSGKSGNEPTSCVVGTFEGDRFIFILSGLSNLVTVWKFMESGTAPLHMQTLPTGLHPEGAVVIESRNLLIVASKVDSRDDKVRSTISIYELSNEKPQYPTIVSAENPNVKGIPIAWGALSGLSSDPNDNNVLYAVEDSAYMSNRVFKIDISSVPAIIYEAITLRDTNGIFRSFGGLTPDFTAEDLDAMINEDGTVNIDMEGIAASSDGYFYIASEGKGTIGDEKRPIKKLNFIFKVEQTTGTIAEVLTLPDDFNAIQLRFGIEGIALDEDAGILVLAIQRAWGDEENPRIWWYNLENKSWSYAYYPLDNRLSPNGGWVGLGDITSIPGSLNFLVLERDNQGGPDAFIKRTYKISLSGVNSGETISKQLDNDLMDDIASFGGVTFEKMEGLTLVDNTVYLLNDNDGVDFSTGETQLIQYEYFTKALEITAPFGELPPNLSSNSEAAWASLVEAAFPTWCIDSNENRLTARKTCDDGTPNGRYSPLYLTKWHGGEDPALGGYPTDVDTRYPFYFASGFFGQACAGGNSHCSFDFDGGKNNCARCGKIVTNNDDGPNGPGHVPPHIGLAALTRAYHDGGFGDVNTWFDFAQNGCRVLPSVLLPMIRKYFPRNEDGSVKYPPPFTTDGGPGDINGSTYPYPLEYVNLVGASCTKEQKKFPSADCYETHSNLAGVDDYPTYLKPGHGSPHYCTVEGMNADVNKDWCPYIFFGPKRGKYRHPHIAYAAVEVWLANKVMPNKCGKTWDDNDGKDYPFIPNHSIAFPKMTEVEGYKEHPKQPVIDRSGGFIWPGDEGTKRKAVPGTFVLEKYLKPTVIGEPISIPTGNTQTETTDVKEDNNRLSDGAIVGISIVGMICVTAVIITVFIQMGGKNVNVKGTQGGAIPEQYQQA